MIQVRLALGLLFLGASVLLWHGEAHASSVDITIDDSSPTLEVLDKGGWTSSLAFTNLTDEALLVSVEAAVATDAGCTPTLDKTSLPPAEHATVVVTIPAGCQVREDGFDFRVKAAGAAGPVKTFEITAAPKPDGPVSEWEALWAFPIAFGSLIVGALVLFLIWDAKDTQNPKDTQNRSITQPLKYLDASWSFKDNWVSNVTVGAGLLTGIFGSSSAVKSILGEDADRSIALATVGAAISVAFIAAGPLVLLSTKQREENAITVFGLLAAAVVTLTGAFGELWVVYRSGSLLDLGGWEDNQLVFIVPAALLLLYAKKTLIDALERGTTRPSEPPASDTILAARMIVEALKAIPNTDTEALNRSFEQLTKEYPVLATSTGDDYLPRRSALL